MTVGENVRAVQERAAEAAIRSGRRPEEVRLITVTKTIEKERILEAIGAGANRIGENRVQELIFKLEFLPETVEKHVIGQLQSNKARQVVGVAALVHSLDRLSLAAELNRVAAARGLTVDALVEVNIGGEESKGGVAPSALLSLLERLCEFPNLRIRGLMTVPPRCTETEARRYFASLRELMERAGREFPSLPLAELSMGMSADFEAAILEGATYVRVGSAIFGARR